MAILGSLARYLRSGGRLLYAADSGVGGYAGKRRRKAGWARTRYMEMMEPRLLLSTVFGGETYTYTDASGQTITAQLNGSVATELVGSVQSGGLASTPARPIPVTANEGVLLYGDIVGRFTSGPRNGTIIGNGSVPVTGGSQGSSQIRGAGIPAYGGVGKQVNIRALASDKNGTTWAFNTFFVDAANQPIPSANNTSAFSATVQIILMNGASRPDGTGVVRVTNTSDSLLPIVATANTITAVSIPAAAFDPFNNLIYFDVHSEITNNGTTGGVGTGNVINDEMWTFNPANLAIADVGPLNVSKDAAGKPRMDVRGMTFVVNGSAPTSAVLYVAEQPNANAAGAPAPAPPLQPRLDLFAVNTAGSVNLGAFRFMDIYEGFGGQRAQLVNVQGIASIPGTLPNGGDQYIYAAVNIPGTEDATARLVRLDVRSATTDPTTGDTNIEGTRWGNTTDLYETAPTVRVPRNSFDGRSASGLTYNPVAIDPFTGTAGAFLFVDAYINNVPGNINGIAGTGDLAYANKNLHIDAGDAFQVYSTISDINASVTFSGSTLYQNQAFLGFNGQIPDNTTNGTFVAGNPFLTGQLNAGVGMLPQVVINPSTGLAGTILTAGLTVGRSLEHVLSTTSDVTEQTLGANFNNVLAMAISAGGTIVAINSDPYNVVNGASNGVAPDQIGIVDPATGLVQSFVNVHLANQNPLQLVEGLAFGDPSFNGNERLYAVYDLHDGNGPTLGTINIATGVFTTIGKMNLGPRGQAMALAFTPGADVNDPTHQGLYVIADPNMQDNDSTQSLYRVDLVTGSAILPPSFGGVGNLSSANGIGKVLTQSDGSPVLAASISFDSTGRPLVVDRRSGRLLDLNLATGVAGANFSTAPGSINPTVAGVIFDPDSLSFFAIDNVTGNHTIPAGGDSTAAVLMAVSDFTQGNTGDPVSLGKFLFDGTVTGVVNVSGSMDTFFADEVSIGDARNGGNWFVPASFYNDNTNVDNAAKEDYFHNNFNIGGDLRNLLSLNDIGRFSNTASAGVLTHMEILAGGKVGYVRALGTFAGVVHSQDHLFGPSIPDVSADGLSGQVQQEVQHYYGDNTDFPSFGAGFLVDSGGTAPFGNTTFASAQFLGTIRNAVSGDPDVIHLQGIVEAGPPPNPNNVPNAPPPAQPPRINQQVDYFAFGLLAGQTVDVTVAPFTNPLWANALAEPMNFGIFNPDGTLVYSDFSDVNSLETEGRTIRFTADRPGAWRVAVQIAGGRTNFTGGIFGVNASYDLKITGIGDMAIGGVVANGQVNLLGSNWITNSTFNTGSTVTNPSIWADTGDVGAVIAGAGPNGGSNNATAIIATIATVATSGLTGSADSPSRGLSFNGSSSGDFTVSNGNLRAVHGGQLGQFVYTGNNVATASAVSLSRIPDFNVSGIVGLLETPTADNSVNFSMLAATFGNAAGGNIQVISSGGDVEGAFRSNQAIGIVRAALVSNAFVVFPSQLPFDVPRTEFHADADRANSDGVIDLIDVNGNFGGPIPILGGTVIEFGPALVTGPGGDVRFMRVGGIIHQDSVFDNGATGARGEIPHAQGQSVSFPDDSGASLTLTPGNLLVVNGTNPATSVAGTLTTRTYGVRGAGGVVLVDVTSTAGIIISSNPGGLGRAAEVGTINVGGSGTPLVLTGGTPTIDATQTANTATANVVLSSSGDARLDVFDITNLGSAGTAVGTTTINSISNTSTGDIFQVHARDVGSITAHGNIGTMYSTTGAVLNTLTVLTDTSGNILGNTYPFVNQTFGISALNIGLIAADKSIGNVIVDAGSLNTAAPTMGIVGSIIANRDGVDDPNAFEGISGPIVINGSVAGPTTNTVTQTNVISLSTLNIGEGIPWSGSGVASRAGVFAQARINSISANVGADIRGDIVSTNSIGNITLNNGSIVNAHIGVWTTYNMASLLFPITQVGITALRSTPQLTVNIENPIYNIDSIIINGNGGIMGSIIEGSSINNITVGPSGFGIFSSAFRGGGIGTLNNITAGGYGIQGITSGILGIPIALYPTVINFARVNNISATGSGAPSDISNYSLSVRASEHFAFDPNTGQIPNALSDLDVLMLGDDVLKSVTPDPEPAPVNTGNLNGLTTGIVWVHASGQDRLGNVSAYNLVDSALDFSLSTGAVNVRHDVFDTRFITGKVASLTVNNNAENFEFTVPGPIGTVLINGSLLPAADASNSRFSPVTTVTQILAKGPSGTIASATIKGDVGGLIGAESSIGTLVINGDFWGTITVAGNHIGSNAIAFNLLHILGSIIDVGELTRPVIRINGNAGTIEIAKDMDHLAELLVNGNLGNLLVGDDTTVNGSVLATPLTINGNLTNAVITGSMTGAVIITGNVGKFAVNTDPAPGTGLLSGSLTVGGVFTALTVQGNATGRIIANTFTNAQINGDLSGSLIGGMGIASATINGALVAGGEVTSSLGDIKKLLIKTGSLDGKITAPNGSLAGLTLAGDLGATGNISAKTISGLTIPGAVAGTVSASGTLSSIKAGSVLPGADISAAFIASLTTTGDFNGIMSSGYSTAASKIAIGANFGGIATFASPAAVTINGSMATGSLFTTTSNLTSFAVKGVLSGGLLVDRYLSTLTAGSLMDAVITGGLGISSIKVTGGVTNSLVQAGLSRGNDATFGTGDLGEQSRMADITTFAVGSITGSIVAAGGNIGTFTSTGVVTDSSISSGLVLGGANISAVLLDTSPLADGTELDAARQNSTLFHGSVKSASISAAGTNLVNSSLTAGVSPGADGAFGTADDNVNSSLTGGNSSFTSLKATPDGTSSILANTPGGGATLVTYTTDGSQNSIVQNDPINGGLVAVATPGTPVTWPVVNGTVSNSITVTITGDAGSSVSIYDDPNTTDRVDTLLISSTSSKPVSVVVTTTAPGALDLGRVITSDNTQVGTFTFNGDILGDVNGGPALWLDSDVATFAVRNLPNDGAWNGQIGGNVTTLNISQLGPGRLRIGGSVKTATIASSVGNPLIQQLGTVTPATNITEMAFDANSGNTFATDGTNLLGVDVNSGTINSSVPVHTILNGSTLTLNGMAFDSTGILYGVATLNNQNPITQVGPITTTGDKLRGMAVNDLGQIFAIDSSSGVDTLVQLDPVTGAETVIGVIRNQKTDTYTNSIMALAFDNTDDQDPLALVKDRDGNGITNTSADGVALARITVSGGTVRIGNPTSKGLLPVLIGGGVQGNFTGMAVKPNDATNTIYAVRNIAGVDELDTILLTGNASNSTATLTTAGNIKLDGGATNTATVGIGFDENGNLLGLNIVTGAGELIGINTAAPATSERLDIPSLIPTALNAFAMGRSGANFRSYAYTTDVTTGGTLFTNPGVVATLGTISTSGPGAGGFLEMLPLTQDNQGTPLAGNVRSIAVDITGNVFVNTDQGILAQYSGADGSLITGQPLGQIQDTLGNPLDVTRIAFDDLGSLIGLNAGSNDLVNIDTLATVVNGHNVVLASNLTDPGTAIASDLTALTFDNTSGKFLSYSKSLGSFVNILGTSPDNLGGLVANSISALNLPSGFGGRIAATGNGAANAIDSVKFTGNATFTGNISSDSTIGSVGGTGTTFSGSIISRGDLGTFALTGGMSDSGVVSVNGLVNTFTFTGNMGGALLAGQANTITINGSLLPTGVIVVANTVSSLTVTGQIAGTIEIGGVKTFKANGVLANGGLVSISGDASSVTLAAGTELGSTFWAGQGITTLVVGGSLNGTVAARRTVSKATFNNFNGGLFDVGGDITTLTVNGSMTDALISSGTWIGADRVFNTSDDVIFGGSIVNGKVSGVYTDSAITAGVLPRQGGASGPNNIPTDNRSYSGNPLAPDVADVDSAEGGGIALSSIQNLTITKPVVTTAADAGLLSVVVAANSLGKIVASANLQRIVRTDPPGAPAVVTDPTTLQPEVVRYSLGEIRITFDEPIDSATLDATSIIVTDLSRGTDVSGLTFGYFNVTAPDGSVQGVIRVFSSTNFGGATSVQVTLQGGLASNAITDRTGRRSSLFDYNQDGVPDAGGDPFGTTVAAGAVFTIPGIPTNDNFANAINLAGSPVSVTGLNGFPPDPPPSRFNATTETNEFSPGAGNTVWWNWTATRTGSVTIDTAGSNFDTVLSVYTGSSLTALGLIATNNNDGALETSKVTFNAVAGTTYRIQVDGSINAAVPVGTISLNIT